MIEFLKIQYRLNKLSTEQLNKLVDSGRISERDKQYIIEKSSGDS